MHNTKSTGSANGLSCLVELLRGLRCFGQLPCLLAVFCELLGRCRRRIFPVRLSKAPVETEKLMLSQALCWTLQWLVASSPLVQIETTTCSLSFSVVALLLAQFARDDGAQ